jgi:hypothetical protein
VACQKGIQSKDEKQIPMKLREFFFLRVSITIVQCILTNWCCKKQTFKLHIDLCKYFFSLFWLDILKYFQDAIQTHSFNVFPVSSLLSPVAHHPHLAHFS